MGQAERLVEVVKEKLRLVAVYEGTRRRRLEGNYNKVVAIFLLLEIVYLNVSVAQNELVSAAIGVKSNELTSPVLPQCQAAPPTASRSNPLLRL